MGWIEPVANRSGGEKYGVEDLNRVGNDVQYLADLLKGYGYDVLVNTKTDWTINGEPNVSDMSTYLNNISALKDAFYGTTALPCSMSQLSAEQANNIEKLLIEVETYITKMITAFRHPGMAISGIGGLIA